MDLYRAGFFLPAGLAQEQDSRSSVLPAAALGQLTDHAAGVFFWRNPCQHIRSYH